MSKLVVTEFVSLDGIMGEPQDWSFPYWDQDIETFKHDELFASDIQLLGRRTYEGFASAWPSRTGDFAERLNASPKYVVSSTLLSLTWQNTHLTGSDLPGDVRHIKEQSRGDVLVHGSRTLVQALIREDLVDEYHLLVYPLLLGQGLQLFESGHTAKLRLIESRRFRSGVVLLRYEPTR